MIDENSQTFESLPLDPDESGHMALIPESVHARLLLANNGARLTLYMMGEAGTRYLHGSPPFFVLRSLIRAANFARFSVIGLLLGYYAGAASQIRMAYESLLYALLFNLHPDKALSWLRTTLDTQMDKDTSISEEQRLRAQAKEVFNEWSGEKDLGREIWDRASSLMHNTVEGLAIEAGLEPWQLLSEELVEAMKAAEGDFDSAIKLTSLLLRYGSTQNDKQPVKKDESGLPWTGEFGGLFDEEWLEFWSMILLYLVHRMTDFAYRIFPPSDKEMKEGYQGWHEAVKAAS